MKSTMWTRTYENRGAFIGGSDARIIMGNEEVALIQLWREKRGEAEPQDLSGNLIVQLGAATEKLNRSWYERNTGRRVSDVQRYIKHSAIPWMAATLDASSREPKPCSRPSSCCRGHFRRRPLPKSTWPRSSTTCGSPICGARCSRSSLAVANGSGLRSRGTHSISCWSLPKRSPGAACNLETRPI